MTYREKLALERERRIWIARIIEATHEINLIDKILKERKVDDEPVAETN